MIIKEIENSIKHGCKEIWVTSQDNASYEYNGIKLPELLNEISDISGKFFVRVGMMNPKNVLPILKDLINSYKNKKIYNFLHLPVQSGDNRILEKMNRGYKVEDFLKIVEEFRKNLKIQLWTDVIIGFPGETEEKFGNTVKLIKKIRPDWVNVSKFGKRPKTPVKKFKQISSKIISKRSEEISKIVRQISLEKNREWINWEGDILISKKGKNPGQWMGRNFAYKNILIENKENLLGKFVKIEVKEANYSHLKGILK